MIEHWKNMSLDPIHEEYEGVMYCEKWLPVVGYEDLYMVSNFGRIKNLYTYNWPEDIKSQRAPSNGYLLVSLWKDNKEKKKLVHRLVAAAFVQNPDKKKTVNHKKGIKTDNRFHQLEWSTQGENALHSYKELGRKARGVKGKYNTRAIAIIKYDKSGNELARFDTVSDAAKSVSTSTTHISSACKGKYKIVRGFKWEYA